MAEKTTVRVTGSFSFCGALAIVFITLKLLGKIDWSWVWVLAPIWIPLVLFGGLLLLIVVVAFVSTKVK